MPKKKEHQIIDGIECKSCSKCENWFSLSEFQKNMNFSWDGLANYCKACSKINDGAKYLKRKDAVTKRSKEYYQENKSYVTQRNKAYQEKHREEIGLYKSNWQKENREKRNKRLSERYRNEPNYRIAVNLRNRLLVALKNNQRSSPTLALLGCSIDFFRQHMESMFVGEMSWNNHGTIWHIDHIKPCAKFDLSDGSHQKICFHYTNMQPLFVKDNLIKGDR